MIVSSDIASTDIVLADNVPKNTGMGLPVAHVYQKHADFLSLVQISDLHLFADDTQLYNGINPAHHLQAVLELIANDYVNSDAILLTGDLFQQPNVDSYNRLFAQVATLGLPMLAIAGNHDVTLELDSHLPFSDRRHVAVKRDVRLLNCHVTSSEFWDIICLDSAVNGKVYGYFDEQTLSWLEQTLANSDKPCVIFAHHPMLLVGSAWIDKHTLKNSDAFWAVVRPFKDKVKGIFVGHVHQDLHLVFDDISLYTCPATSVQFKSFCDDYTLDNLPAGLRWITLYNNGTLATGVKRLDGWIDIGDFLKLTF